MRLIDADALERRLNGWYDPYHKGGDEIEIDTLFDMIDEESTDFGWISVKERLPEDFDTKVVWTDRGILYLATFTGLRWYTSGGDTIRDEEVTHWMPLPDTPEVEE